MMSHQALGLAHRLLRVRVVGDDQGHLAEDAESPAGEITRITCRGTDDIEAVHTQGWVTRRAKRTRLPLGRQPVSRLNSL